MLCFACLEEGTERRTGHVAGRRNGRATRTRMSSPSAQYVSSKASGSKMIDGPTSNRCPSATSSSKDKQPSCRSAAVKRAAPRRAACVYVCLSVCMSVRPSVCVCLLRAGVYADQWLSARSGAAWERARARASVGACVGACVRACVRARACVGRGHRSARQAPSSFRRP